jgi:hypothetical protein
MSTVCRMKQPIAGVTPPELREATVMTVWPSLAASGLGRFLGRLYAIDVGVRPLTVGRLLAVASIPLVVALYFGRFAAELLSAVPWVGRFLALAAPAPAQRYVLTNRRVVVRGGLIPHDQRWVALNRFDAIAIDVRPGQEWYRAGDLVFRLGAIETFRLAGVVRPETFRHTCLEARRGYLGVEEALAQ